MEVDHSGFDHTLRWSSSDWSDLSPSDASSAGRGDRANSGSGCVGGGVYCSGHGLRFRLVASGVGPAPAPVRPRRHGRVAGKTAPVTLKSGARWVGHDMRKCVSTWHATWRCRRADPGDSV